MAYMFHLGGECQRPDCGKDKTHRVCNGKGDTVGDFCKRHAMEAMRSAQNDEDKMNRLAGQLRGMPDVPTR